MVFSHRAEQMEYICLGLLFFLSDKSKLHPLLLMAWTISSSLAKVLLAKELTYEISLKTIILSVPHAN